MENKYDNEFVRKQLYDFYGKPKGVTYEEFSTELDKMVKYFNEQSIENDKFKKDYYVNHKLCPKCGALQYSTTLVDYVFHPNNNKDLNLCVCCKCNDRHTTHDRISAEQFNEFKHKPYE